MCLYVLKDVRLLKIVCPNLTLFVVFLGFLGKNPHAHDQCCVCKLDYAHTGLFIRTHEPAQKP